MSDENVIYVVFNAEQGNLGALFLVTFDKERAIQVAKNIKGILVKLPVLVTYYYDS